MDARREESPRERLYDAWASVARAMGNGRRAEIIDVLAHAERSVEEIALEIDQSVANTSHHLGALAAAGLVQAERTGPRRIYRLTSDAVADLWESTRSVATTHVPGIDEVTVAARGRREEVEQVGADELVDRVQRHRAVLIDVRPAVEYVIGHIPGARSIPLEMLEMSLDALPRSQEILVYCRGRHCAYADEAVRILHLHDYDARRLDIGFYEWSRSGRPVERRRS